MNGHRRGDFQIVRLVWILLMAWGLVHPPLETGQFLRKAAAAAVQEREVSSSTTAVTPQSAPPRYLIIAPDEFAPALASYIATKQAQGLDVTLQTLSQTGPTRENIRTAIRNFSPNYLLLVGDVDLLPAWENRSGLTTFTDLYYTTLDGPNDSIPNLPYARLPVHSSAELQAVLAKWAAYEALDGSQAWLSRAAFIASGETDDYSTAEQVHNAMIEQYTAEIGFSGSFPNNPQPGGDRLYARTYSATPADISAALNAGRGLAVYFGQGGTLGWNSPYFTTSEVQQLNGPPLPLLVSFAGRNALLSAEQNSFAENWLVHPTSGALSVFAAGADTTRSADERLEEELFRALFAQPSNPPRLGSALLEAMEEFSRYYFLNQTFVQQYYEMYALWGDPTLRLWPDAPQRFSLELDPQTVSVCAGAAQTLAMQVTLKSAQTPAVTLSLPNPPPGVSGTFSANPVHSPGSAVLTLHLSSDLAPGEHTLTVRGESDFIRQDAALPLTVHPAAPEQTPLPLLPANGASGVPLRPQLSWSAVGGAAGYEVQIALDSSFEQIVTAAGNTPQTAYTLTEDLQPGQTYYWRVRALNGCGAGEFSPPARFTTRPPAGECPPHSRAEVLYSQTFDAPAGDWQMQNGWQTGSAFGRGGVVSAAAPAEILLQSLTSPLLSLPAEADVLAVHLRAETAYHFGEAGACLDGALLQISNDDGEHWTAVSDEALLTPPYEGALATSFGNPLGGERAWCGQRDWGRLAADLSAFRGDNVHLRFLTGSGDDAQSASGIALDNFEVIACRAEEPVRRLNLTPGHQSAVFPAGSTHSFIWQLSNTGAQSEQVELNITGDLPVGLPTQSLFLDAAETREIQVEVSLPADAAPGEEYPITLQAITSDQNLWAAAGLTVTVQQCGLLLGAPQTLPPPEAGKPYPLQVTLTNTGNAADTFTLTAVNSLNWAVEIPPPAQIQPRASLLVDLLIYPPSDTLPADENRVSITARSAACPSVQQTLERRIAIAGSRLFLPLIGR